MHCSGDKNESVNYYTFYGTHDGIVEEYVHDAAMVTRRTKLMALRKRSQ